MNGTITRWVVLALAAALAAASAGCVAPVDSEPDESEDVATSDQSLGAVVPDNGAPEEEASGVGVPAQSGDVLPGEDCVGPEPQPWDPPGRATAGDDGDDGDDTDHNALTHTSVSTPSGGHHGH